MTGVTEAVRIVTPDRIPDWFDFYCDMAGALGGAVVFILFSHLVIRRLKFHLFEGVQADF